MTTSTEIEVAKPKASILAKFSERYSVEPTKMLETLKGTCFKGNVTNEQMIALLVVADQYQLNPFTKEIFAFPDKNSIVPVVSVDGWLRIINSHPQMDGIAFDQDSESCTCTIYRKDRQHPTKVTEWMAECKRGNTGPWQTHPYRMLRHKSLIQCARIAFGFGGIYDQDEAERIVASEPSQPKHTTGSAVDKLKQKFADKGDVIDMETGEITPEQAEKVLSQPMDKAHDEFLAGLGD